MTRLVAKVFSSDEEWSNWIQQNAYRIVRVQEFHKSGTKWYAHYFLSEPNPSQIRKLGRLQVALQSFEKAARTIPADMTEGTADDLIRLWLDDLSRMRGGTGKNTGK